MKALDAPAKDNNIVISADPLQTKNIHKVISIKNDYHSFKTIKKADNIIFGGGQLFSDRNFKISEKVKRISSLQEIEPYL